MSGLLAGAWAAAQLSCSLMVASPLSVGLNGPVVMQVELHNTGSQSLQLLVWGTPFEPGWWGPSVRVFKGETELRYRGPMAKRGDALAADYLHLAPGTRRSVQTQLQQVFDLRQAGLYRVQPQFHFHDVLAAAQAPSGRARSDFQPLRLNCPDAAFELTSP